MSILHISTPSGLDFLSDPYLGRMFFMVGGSTGPQPFSGCISESFVKYWNELFTHGALASEVPGQRMDKDIQDGGAGWRGSQVELSRKVDKLSLESPHDSPNRTQPLGAF